MGLDGGVMLLVRGSGRGGNGYQVGDDKTQASPHHPRSLRSLGERVASEKSTGKREGRQTKLRSNAKVNYQLLIGTGIRMSVDLVEVFLHPLCAILSEPMDILP